MATIHTDIEVRTAISECKQCITQTHTERAPCALQALHTIKAFILKAVFLFALVQLVSLNNLLLLVFLDLFIAPPTLVLDNLSSRYVFRRGYLTEKKPMLKVKGRHLFGV